MNKNFLVFGAIVVVVGVGGYVILSKNKGGQGPGAQEPVISATPSPDSSITPTGTPTSASTPQPAQTPKPVLKEFNVTAKQYAFEPNPITVNKGDRVKLNVKTLDVTHGISIPDFGVNAIVKPGVPMTVEFVASKAGTYGIFCSEYCGAGHPDMKGLLIVK